jgi:short subunit dehydrogenase-like uncharacterized protein
LDDRSWLLYGAYGYTGRHIAEKASRVEPRPVLAGRDRGKTRAIADALDCPARAFPLDAPADIARQLEGVRLVLNCAGPFSATAGPMIEACLAAGVHYLDITGEIAVIESAAQCHDRAVAAGVSVIPAVGFDVVPSDCLAAMLAERLPSATRLQLAFTFTGGVSPGTAKTMLEGLASGAWVRVDGRLVRAAWAEKTIEVPFPDGPRQAVTVPWGDVAAAWHSTGIGNIEVFLAMAPGRIRWLRFARRLFPAMKSRPFAAQARWGIGRFVAGPSAERNATSRSWLWGRVEDASGQRAEATLEAPGGYPITVSAALASVDRVLAGAAPIGFSTPSKAFGAEFVLGLPGTELRWIDGEARPVSGGE